MREIIECNDEELLLEKFQKMFDKKDYENCIVYIEKKLSAFSNKFYDVMIIYLNSLINAKQEEKALKLVKEELEMPYIPSAYEEKFLNIYKEIAYIEKKSKEFNLSKEKIEEVLCLETDKNMIILALIELCKLNIRDFYESIKCFFNRDVKNIYKVMLIDALRSQGVNEAFNIRMYGKEYTIIPSLSENVLETKVYLNIKEILEKKMNNKDLNLNSLALENLMLYLSDIYFIKVEKREYNLIACALHYYASKMYDENLKIDDFCSIYDVQENECLKYLEELERACSI